MTRDEKLNALADVLLTAAVKAKELSDTGTRDGYLSRETALAIQIEGIAHEFKALAAERATGPATDAFSAMEDAVKQDKSKAGSRGKRTASIKETGEELPQEQWERFGWANKKLKS